MNYHIVLFIKPESIDYSGPQRWKVARGKFERVCDPAVTMIQLEEDVYRLDDKKIFSIENRDNETTDSIIVCEAHKLKQQ